jgi:hypothetical protein
MVSEVREPCVLALVEHESDGRMSQATYIPSDYQAPSFLTARSWSIMSDGTSALRQLLVAYLRDNCVASRLRSELASNAAPLFLVYACDDLNVRPCAKLPRLVHVGLVRPAGVFSGSMHVCMYACIYLSIHLSIYLSIYLSTDIICFMASECRSPVHIRRPCRPRQA